MESKREVPEVVPAVSHRNPFGNPKPSSGAVSGYAAAAGRPAIGYV